MNAALRDPCVKLRGPITRRPAGASVSIDRDGGDYGAGLLHDVAIVTRGEARGHGEWLDRTFLHQVSTQLNAAHGGLKSRFTHPGISGDGLGKALGRVRRARVDGDAVKADLHLFETAKKAPDGDLADYVMRLAQEDSTALGLSIVFMPDAEMTDAFTRAHADRRGKFTSPDELNAEHLPHVRLAELMAVDAVDEPASNPGGLFHRSRGLDIAQAETATLYALGLTDTRPDVSLDIHADRLRGFVSRLLEREGYTITKTGAERSARRARARLLRLRAR